ncbi:MAG: hypothetical protein HOM14_15280 [Gammaproteobacteria bacterium]|jgi:hypothetical protein|nr:hypothetical protein [Gammaproteobacteria bacterium]MBT4196453.1 hypothetical protein [Gammaproteobacteria bacterium]MBT4448580.1 hypothetical protein [Gammaproteobacteria bacterium]MBT6456015.1 hypothetical protein [Gammaproteobacteria bacterium]MBT6552710.1 hypothetical protein [Gammaproteobacteria bacterium]
MKTFTKSESDFELPAAGTTTAILTQMAFVGKQKSVYQGQEKIRDIVRLGYELPDLTGQDGYPLAIFEELTVSFNEKAKLYQRVKSLNGGREPAEGSELRGLMGSGALITIAHTVKGDRTYANIEMLTPMPASMPTPQAKAELLYFDIDEPDKETYELLPPRTKKLIQERIRTEVAPAPIQQQPQAQPPQPEKFDDIPF